MQDVVAHTLQKDDRAVIHNQLQVMFKIVLPEHHVPW